MELWPSSLVPVHKLSSIQITQGRDSLFPEIRLCNFGDLSVKEEYEIEGDEIIYHIQIW